MTPTKEVKNSENCSFENFETVKLLKTTYIMTDNLKRKFKWKHIEIVKMPVSMQL